ncbi:hypothetical protein TRL7639_01621 [Falsiruegeria litorea R37]|uniref:DUF2950 domain-containing protein n=1 Tax=Falsiruegeria litorea R37 TaxID=1200284 RepID=A0A1Y5S8N2_9RHOB|nr:DUF2950 domain-containing protein [Falsiruegeria litorea]SLN34949.1 hypothetical protein TRL7639_01621 [Falsiruegeria litorea R37]
MKTRTFSTAIGALALTLAMPLHAAEDPADYASPQEALDAMMTAVAAQDTQALLSVFGNDAEELLSSGNPDRDQQNRAEILNMYGEGYRFLPSDEGHVTLLLGADSWPFPIPIARTDAGWAFDIVAGEDEIHARRIGLNELETIEMLQAYVDIQAEYRLTDHDGDGVMEFASALLSSPQGRDGLFWADADSPLGERIAIASLDGYNDGQDDQDPEPFGGYYYRILTGQTDNAPGGAMDYQINGNMVAGHAMLAVPADYGNSGITSFVVGENGVIYEADLGEDTLDAAHALTSFDPGPDWAALE